MARVPRDRSRAYHGNPTDRMAGFVESVGSREEKSPLYIPYKWIEF